MSIVLSNLAGKDLRSINFSLAATGTVVPAVTGKKIKVYAVKVVVDAAIGVYFRDGGATALEGMTSLAANGGFIEQVSPPSFLFATSVDNALDLVITGTGTAAGRISYFSDDSV